jgi:hypothetical protein
MYGFVIGGLAVAWGVLAAFLEQPGAAARRRATQLCTALLVACAAVGAAGGVASAAGVW